ncbi:MAG: hypothetical protein H3C47_14305 [Candidatus Cloacimonetes bacterium]|nr:hypothetical protein [Candidatus Cloacimonadota bacterium]
MKILAWILVSFILLFQPALASQLNFLQSEETYVELEAELDASEKEKLLPLIRSTVFKRILQQPYLETLHQIPEEVWLSFQKYEKLLQYLLDTQLLQDWDKVQYQIVREALMTASRAQIQLKDRDIVKILASGPLPAVFSDIEFRSIVYQLHVKKILLPWVKGLADYEELKLEPNLKDLMSSPEFMKESGEVQLSKVMEALQDQGEEVLSKGRRLRDLRWFEIVASSEFGEIFQNEGSLGKVFYELIKNSKHMTVLRQAGQTDALELALHGSIHSGRDWIRSTVSRYMSLSDEFRNPDSKFMDEFLESPVMEYLFSWKYAYEVKQLLRGSILGAVVSNLSLLKILNSPSMARKFEMVQKRISEAREKRLLQEKRQNLRASEKDECLKNMDLLMSARSGYNRKYRQGIDLNSREGQNRMRGFLPKGIPVCPAQGEYRNSEREWIYCTLHGPARIPDSHE